MVACGTACLRRLGGRRSAEVRFGRFLANPRVTVERLIDGWGRATAVAAGGRHVLAIQDTTELNFRTASGRDRGLGEIGKGVGRGLLVHAMLAVDAQNGHALGLVGGRIWTRRGRVTTPHGRRRLSDKESERWPSTAAQAKAVLTAAAMVTVVADRESDIYAVWAAVPAERVHVLGRVYSDRLLAEGGDSLFTTLRHWPVADTASLEVRERVDRPARTAIVSLRFGTVRLRRPRSNLEPDLPKTVAVSVIEVVESAPPPGVPPLHWRLLTSHAVPDQDAAWRIVGWYTRRWTIEQLFRLLKTQGLRIEDSQLDTAERLLKLAAIATRAAAVTLQLVQARDGQGEDAADIAFSEPELRVLEALAPTVEGRTARQRNPHPPGRLAWAAWIIGRFGGWDGYPSSRPPGPITFKRGLDRFHAFAAGWLSRDLCMP